MAGQVVEAEVHSPGGCRIAVRVVGVTGDRIGLGRIGSGLVVAMLRWRGGRSFGIGSALGAGRLGSWAVRRIVAVGFGGIGSVLVGRTLVGLGRDLVHIGSGRIVSGLEVEMLAVPCLLIGMYQDCSQFEVVGLFYECYMILVSMAGGVDRGGCFEERM